MGETVLVFYAGCCGVGTSLDETEIVPVYCCYNRFKVKFFCWRFYSTGDDVFGSLCFRITAFLELDIVCYL